MSAVIVNYKKTQAIDKTRSIRPINVAHSLIPITKRRNDKSLIENVLFHKNLSGHIMIGLSASNEPITVWRDINAIIPIKSSLVVDPARFKQIIVDIQPKKVYLNDGSLLGKLNNCELIVYSNKTLLQILNDIAIKRHPIEKKDNNNIPTFKDMLIMDPQITRREYNKFCKRLLSQQ